jgi:ATP-dependent Clp protease protease subunit
MKLNHINPTRMDEEQEPHPQDNMMENMVSGARFDKKFIEQRKIFLWGVVDLSLIHI